MKQVEFQFSFCVSDLCWESDDGERNGQRRSHSDDDSVGVVEGGDGSHHVWKAQGDHSLLSRKSQNQYVIKTTLVSS